MSSLGRASACAAISLLMPTLTANDAELVYRTIDLLLDGLSKAADNRMTDVLAMHYGIGVGLVLDRLFGDHFADVAGSRVS